MSRESIKRENVVLAIGERLCSICSTFYTGKVCDESTILLKPCLPLPPGDIFAQSSFLFNDAIDNQKRKLKESAEEKKEKALRKKPKIEYYDGWEPRETYPLPVEVKLEPGTSSVEDKKDASAENLRCEICDIRFDNVRAYMDHARSSTKIHAEIKDQFRKNSSSQPEEKEDDDQGENPPSKEEYECYKCLITFISDAARVKHMEKDHFYCSVCNVTMSSRAALKGHNSKIHAAKVGKVRNCMECGSIFFCFLEHEAHIRTHIDMTKEDPDLQCRFCGKLFPFSAHTLLEKHLNVHEDLKCECPRCKNQGVKMEPVEQKPLIELFLDMSKVKVEGKNPYRCAKCLSSFPKIEFLEDHFRSLHSTNIKIHVNPSKKIVKSKLKVEDFVKLVQDKVKKPAKKYRILDRKSFEKAMVVAKEMEEFRKAYFEKRNYVVSGETLNLSAEYSLGYILNNGWICEKIPPVPRDPISEEEEEEDEEAGKWKTVLWTPEGMRFVNLRDLELSYGDEAGLDMTLFRTCYKESPDSTFFHNLVNEHQEYQEFVAADE